MSFSHYTLFIFLFFLSLSHSLTLSNLCFHSVLFSLFVPFFLPFCLTLLIPFPIIFFHVSVLSFFFLSFLSQSHSPLSVTFPMSQSFLFPLSGLSSIFRHSPFLLPISIFHASLSSLLYLHIVFQSPFFLRFVFLSLSFLHFIPYVPLVSLFLSVCLLTCFSHFKKTTTFL